MSTLLTTWGADVALRLVLWLLSLRIRWLNAYSRPFRYALRNTGQVLQFATADGRVKRFFQFEKGDFTSRARMHPNAAVAATQGLRGERILVFTFKTSTTGLSVLQQAQADESEILRAMGDGRLTLSGDFTLFIWLGGLLKML